MQMLKMERAKLEYCVLDGTNTELPLDDTALCYSLGHDGSFPWFAIRNTKLLYRRFWIDKDTREFVNEFDGQRRLREICAPSKKLKRLQYGIAATYLANLPKHEANFAYMTGRNIKDAAQVHVNKDVVVKIDLKDFFGSHKMWYLVDKLKNVLGLQPRIAWMIAKICTLEDKMPQGAITSPILSIVLNYTLDVDVKRVADELGFAYTRYADDLCFSANGKSNNDCWALIQKIKTKVRPFKVNWDKVAVMRNKAYAYPFKIIKNSTDNADFIKAIEEAYPGKFQFVEKNGELHITKFGREEVFPHELDFIGTMDFHGELKVKKYYVQSIQHILGLNLTGGVNYPRHKYERLRVEAMLYAKGAANIDKKRFEGKLSYLKQINPAKAEKIERMMNKWRT